MIITLCVKLLGGFFFFFFFQADKMDNAVKRREEGKQKEKSRISESIDIFLQAGTASSASLLRLYIYFKKNKYNFPSRLLV